MPPATPSNPGRLFVVATPLGHLEDISPRAISTLKAAGVIAAEDTRVTKKLLNHYGIDTPVVSFHHHSSRPALQSIISQLTSGKDVAVVTDAGTPGISDPGGLLVAAAYDAGITVIALPGPSAVTTALSVSGLPTDRFNFLGFLPHKKGRETMFHQIAESQVTSIFFESPHRIMKTLTSLGEVLANDRVVVICRELSKMYEEVVRGSAEYVSNVFTDNPGKVRGEFVVVVSGKVE
jgi:16S rRNA (cytidine1402-2'-O)-methyltransferase